MGLRDRKRFVGYGRDAAGGPQSVDGDGPGVAQGGDVGISIMGIIGVLGDPEGGVKGPWGAPSAL